MDDRSPNDMIIKVLGKGTWRKAPINKGDPYMVFLKGHPLKGCIAVVERENHCPIHGECWMFRFTIYGRKHLEEISLFTRGKQSFWEYTKEDPHGV